MLSSGVFLCLSLCGLYKQAQLTVSKSELLVVRLHPGGHNNQVIAQPDNLVIARKSNFGTTSNTNFSTCRIGGISGDTPALEADG